MQPIKSHSNSPIGRVWQHDARKVSQLTSLVMLETLRGQAQLGTNGGQAGLIDGVVVRVDGRLIGQKSNEEVGQNNFSGHSVNLPSV